MWLLTDSLILFLSKEEILQVLRKNKEFITSVVLVSVVLIFATARVGCGVHHMLPFILIYMRLFCEFLGHQREELQTSNDLKQDKIVSMITIVFILTFIMQFTKAPIYYSRVMTFSSFKKDNEIAIRINDDIQNILKQYPEKTIQMGYGGHYPYTYFRLILTFERGIRYPLDPTSFMHWNMVSPMPDESMIFLRRCNTDIFLIPKGGQPFVIKSLFDSRYEVFPDKFKRLFHQNFEFKESSQYFDLWVCKK